MQESKRRLEVQLIPGAKGEAEPHQFAGDPLRGKPRPRRKAQTNRDETARREPVRHFRLTGKGKAPPEGRGEAFRPTAEAADRKRRSQGGGRLQSREVTILASRSRHKRETGNRAMRSPHATKPLKQNEPKRFGKKRGSIRRWSLERSGRSQIQSNGEWTREEDTPFAGWAFVEGGGYDADPGVAEPDRGRRIRCGSHRQSQYAL